MSSRKSIQAVMPSAEIESAAALALAGQWSGAETVLLVEDEAFARQATAEVLASAGYRLVVASSAAEALDAFRKCLSPVDLLLSDVVMPGMSGRDLADEFQCLSPRGRVLLMSGNVGQLEGPDLSHHGKTCLAKPFSVRMLLQKVREVLDTDLYHDSEARA